MSAAAGSVIRYKGGSVCSDDGTLAEGDVWVRSGKITDPLVLFYKERKAPDTVIDCRDLMVAPGFIDIQINGTQPQHDLCDMISYSLRCIWRRLFVTF